MRDGRGGNRLSDFRKFGVGNHFGFCFFFPDFRKIEQKPENGKRRNHICYGQDFFDKRNDGREFAALLCTEPVYVSCNPARRLAI